MYDKRDVFRTLNRSSLFLRSPTQSGSTTKIFACWPSQLHIFIVLCDHYSSSYLALGWHGHARMMWPGCVRQLTNPRTLWVHFHTVAQKLYYLALCSGQLGENLGRKMVQVLISYSFCSQSIIIRVYSMSISRVNRMENKGKNCLWKQKRERSITNSAKGTRKQKAAFMSRRRLLLAACLREVCPALA